MREIFLDTFEPNATFIHPSKDLPIASDDAFSIARSNRYLEMQSILALIIRDFFSFTWNDASGGNGDVSNSRLHCGSNVFSFI
jgi:hypothetical protein